jgi:hypothetical protein
VQDPFLENMLTWGGQRLQPHQSAVIDAAAKLVSRIP